MNFELAISQKSFFLIVSFDSVVIYYFHTTINRRSSDLFAICLLRLPYYHLLRRVSINLLILFRIFHIIP